MMNTAKGYRGFAAFAVILALAGCDISVDGDGSTKVNGPSTDQFMSMTMLQSSQPRL
jgi:hypothetical protein